MIIFLRVLIGVVAVLLIAVGILLTPTPVPIGIVLVIAGLILLSVIVPPIRPALRWLRRRWRWLDRQLDAAQQKLPRVIADPLRKSDPHDDEAEDPDDDVEESAAEDVEDAPPQNDRTDAAGDERAQRPPPWRKPAPANLPPKPPPTASRFLDQVDPDWPWMK